MVGLGLLETGLLMRGCLSEKDPLMPAASSVGPPAAALPEGYPAPVLYVEPEAGFGWVYAQIAGAKSSVDLVMYELADATAVAALVQACQRGVRVRVILDRNLEQSANSPAYEQLAAAGPHCQVAWANPSFHASHQKAMVIDENRAVVMSANLTSRSYAETRDFGVLDTDANDVTSIRLAFEEDFRATNKEPSPPTGGHNLIWGPTTAEDDLVSLIQGARHTLLVENEELSAPVIVDALAAACRRGVAVQLAMTDTSAMNHAAFEALKAAGCGVHVGANDSKRPNLHGTAMVSDLGLPGALGYLGSIDFTVDSMDENRELGLYVHDGAVLERMASVMTGDYNQLPAYVAEASVPGSRAHLP